MTSQKSSVNATQIVIDSLLGAGVKHVFGIPGAKIDAVFNALLDHPEIHLVVCRHEQNAAFISAAIGRITGRPGVCIATSGPGTSNLVTGLVTATTECDPIVAIVGSVSRLQSTKRTHQSLPAVNILSPVTKKSIAVEHEDQLAEVMLDAFRVASTCPAGAYAIVLPMDIISGRESGFPAFPADAFTPPTSGPAPEEWLKKAARIIERAKFPVLFLGMRASDAMAVPNVHEFLRKHPMPVLETFQAAGSISRKLSPLFFGRLGLFRNQPGDKLLAYADLVITVGYDQSEYDANLWNPSNSFEILHIDYAASDYGNFYKPKVELLGSVSENLSLLATLVQRTQDQVGSELCQAIFKEFHKWKCSDKTQPSGPVHPLYFIRLLQDKLSDETVVCVDVGSVYIWLCRYFFSYKPRTFLVSNGQQTLGVALPWAIGASFTQYPPCSKKVVSISGDGGFMFSSQELSTAVQQGCNITHFIWNDGHYNMVEFQEVSKYGRSSGVALGGVDFVKFAESFDAKGFRVTSSEDLERIMSEALAFEGVAVVDINVDYQHNIGLMQQVIPGEIG